MVNLFIDTEFNGWQGDLISMALVSEEGHEWYEVLECDNPVRWVERNVMPNLLKKPVCRVTMQRSLERFLSQFRSDRPVRSPEQSPVCIIADWPEDIRHFCELVITGPGRRIPLPEVSFFFDPMLEANSSTPHNALADARGNMEFYRKYRY